LAVFFIGFGIGFGYALAPRPVPLADAWRRVHSGGQNLPPTALAGLLFAPAPPPPPFWTQSPPPIRPWMAAHPPQFRETASGTVAGLTPSGQWERLVWDAAGSRLFLGLKADGLAYIPFSAGGALNASRARAVPGTAGANGITLAGGVGFTGDGAGSTGACDAAHPGCKVGQGMHVVNLTSPVPAVIATLSVAAGVGCLQGVFDAANGAVWMMLANGSAAVVDAASHSLLATVDIVPGCADPAEPCEPLSHPTWVVLGGVGVIYAASRDLNAVVRISTSTRAVTRFDVSQYHCYSPRGLDVDSGTQPLFLGCSAPDNPLLLVLDATSLSFVASVPIGRGNDGVVFDSNQRAIYASSGALHGIMRRPAVI